MVDYTDLSDVIVDGDVVASRKLKGGQQAINEGEAVLLNASGKVPKELIDSEFITESELDSILSGSGTDQSYTKVWRGTIQGDGSSTSLSVSHGLGIMPSVTIYRNGTVYITDTIVTETQVTLLFDTAPSTNDVFTLVVIG